MRLFLLILSFFSFAVSAAIGAAELEADLRGSYRPVHLAGFVQENQLSEEMIAKKQRLMKQPEAISFEATLVSRPKQGNYTLAYDALNLWSGNEKLPVIEHSAFVGFAAQGPVLGVYVAQGAVKILEQLELDAPAVFYAVHIYTYAKGPRLVIVAAEPVANH